MKWQSKWKERFIYFFTKVGWIHHYLISISFLCVIFIMIFSYMYILNYCWICSSNEKWSNESNYFWKKTWFSQSEMIMTPSMECGSISRKATFGINGLFEMENSWKQMLYLYIKYIKVIRQSVNYTPLSLQTGIKIYISKHKSTII